MLQEGQKAPEIDVAESGAGPFKLSGLKGKWVVVYFYPKDDTPGCTIEACAFRDNMPELTKLGIEVVGVSTQDADSHAKFREKYNLNFHLLPDPSKKIATDYDVLGNGDYAKRMTFLIDPKGVVRDVYSTSQSPATHVTHTRDLVVLLRRQDQGKSP